MKLQISLVYYCFPTALAELRRLTRRFWGPQGLKYSLAGPSQKSLPTSVLGHGFPNCVFQRHSPQPGRSGKCWAKVKLNRWLHQMAFPHPVIAHVHCNGARDLYSKEKLYFCQKCSLELSLATTPLGTARALWRVFIKKTKQSDFYLLPDLSSLMAHREKVIIFHSPRG